MHRDDPKIKEYLRFVHGYNIKGSIVTEFIGRDKKRGYLFGNYQDFFSPRLFGISLQNHLDGFKSTVCHDER